jgi:hypothetical protein
MSRIIQRDLSLHRLTREQIGGHVACELKIDHEHPTLDTGETRVTRNSRRITPASTVAT